MSAPGTMIFSTALPFDGGSLACSPDGARIAVGAAALFNHTSPNGGLAMVSASTGEIRWQILDRSNRAASVLTRQPQAGRAFGVLHRACLRHRPRYRGVRAVADGPARHIAFSGDGALIPTACDDGTIRVFAGSP